MPQLTEKQLENFWSKVNKIPGGCWLWTGVCQKNGYGQVTINNKTLLAHRVIYEHLKNEIPEGLQLDHFYCQTRNCVNPDHVEPVTQRINLLRGNTFGAANIAKTHCPKGHPYNFANTIFYYEGKRDGQRRFCRTCKTLNNRLYKKQLRAS